MQLELLLDLTYRLLLRWVALFGNMYTDVLETIEFVRKMLKAVTAAAIRATVSSTVIVLMNRLFDMRDTEERWKGIQWFVCLINSGHRDIVNWTGSKKLVMKVHFSSRLLFKGLIENILIKYESV